MFDQLIAALQGALAEGFGSKLGTNEKTRKIAGWVAIVSGLSLFVSLVILRKKGKDGTGGDTEMEPKEEGVE